MARKRKYDDEFRRRVGAQMADGASGRNGGAGRPPTDLLAHRHYGSRRVGQMLRREGLRVNRKRVQRLMQADNLLAVRRRQFVATTDAARPLTVYPHLAKRLTITATDQLWVADLTYLRRQHESVYLAVVLDAYSRKVIGGSLGRRWQTSLAVRALPQALTSRTVQPGWVPHSDRGVPRVRRHSALAYLSPDEWEPQATAAEPAGRPTPVCLPAAVNFPRPQDIYSDEPLSHHSSG